MVQQFCLNKCAMWVGDFTRFVIQCDLLSTAIPGQLMALVDDNLALHHLKDSFSPNNSDVKQFEIYLDSLSSSERVIVHV